MFFKHYLKNKAREMLVLNVGNKYQLWSITTRSHSHVTGKKGNNVPMWSEPASLPVPEPVYTIYGFTQYWSGADWDTASVLQSLASTHLKQVVKTFRTTIKFQGRCAGAELCRARNANLCSVLPTRLGYLPSTLGNFRTWDLVLTLKILYESQLFINLEIIIQFCDSYNFNTLFNTRWV